MSNYVTHRLNVVGDFFVVQGCCNLCGVPKNTAPELFSQNADSCYVKKQPRAGAEMDRMIATLGSQDVGCIKYKGTAATVLARLEKIDDGTHAVDAQEVERPPMGLWERFVDYFGHMT